MRNKNIVILLCFLSLSFSGISQKGTHSPYSVFGLGEIDYGSYAAFAAMGGVAVANTDSTIVNSINPASYAYIARHQPVFQVGASGKLSWLSTGDPNPQEAFNANFGLSQFSMGIPVKKNWGMSLGLQPYSFTGYRVSNYVTELDTSTNLNDTTQLFTNEGKGGIRKVYLGTAYRFYNKSTIDTIRYSSVDSTGKANYVLSYKTNRISLGVNGAFLFGSSDRIRTFEYVGTVNGYNSKVVNSLRISAPMLELGLNYEYNFSRRTVDNKQKGGGSLAVGLSYTPRTNLRAYQDLIAYSYYYFGVGAEIINDTVEYVSGNQGTVTLPETFRLGGEYRFGPGNNKNNSITRLAFEVLYQKWTAYSENFGSTSGNSFSFNDRLGISVGYEYTPYGLVRFSPSEKLINRMSYRLGANYTMTELNVNSTSLTNYGMSFGVGWPLGVAESGSVSNTNINLGMNAGMMGTHDQGLIKDFYLGMYVGFSITPSPRDGWFYKRKYD